jgi:uncharacterized protein (TIGR03435 family)
MVRIMSERVTWQLDFDRKLFLSMVGTLAYAISVMFGLLNATSSRAQSPTQSTPATKFVFEVASIKPVKDSGDGPIRLMFRPDGISANNIALRMIIRQAYGVEDNQIVGAPGWLDSERYDIEAKMDPALIEELRKLSLDEGRAARQNALQALLADRLKLAVRRETKQLPVYALVVAKNGPKLQEAKTGDTYPNGIKGPDGVARAGMMRMGRGELTSQALPMSGLARLLSQQLGRTVIDKTGLTAKYDFTLHWTPDEGEGASFPGAGGGPQPTNSAPPSDSSGPSLFTALQEQLGLKLESQKGPVEIIVIEHVERPSEN